MYIYIVFDAENYGFDFTCGLKTTSKRLATRYKLVCLVLSQHNFTGLMRPKRLKQYCLQLYIYIYIYIYIYTYNIKKIYFSANTQ